MRNKGICDSCGNNGERHPINRGPNKGIMVCEKCLFNINLGKI